MSVTTWILVGTAMTALPIWWSIRRAKRKAMDEFDDECEAMHEVRMRRRLEMASRKQGETAQFRIDSGDGSPP